MVVRIDVPHTPNEFHSRDQLLAETMRDSPLLWSYTAEYPLVLAPNPESAKTSLCVFSDNDVIAHLNVWIRQLTHASTGQTQNIALLGNIASHPAHRGQGHIRTLLNRAAESALSENANAMILWSDLLEFYQNLGFTSNGREVRYQIRSRDRNTQTGIVKVESNALSSSDIQAMLDRRPKFEWNLGRSEEEFRSLLSIPECHLFIKRAGARIESWLMIGKGSDMAGVIHEWGARSPDDLIVDIQSILQSYDLQELTLLAPGALGGHWHKVFDQHASSSSAHPMALAKALNPLGEASLKALSKGFIWGLDSI